MRRTRVSQSLTTSVPGRAASPRLSSPVDIELDRQEMDMTARTEHAASSEAGLTGSGPGNSSAAAAPFDSPLSAAMLNIEAKSRSNLFPWRGQFSPQLVEALLCAYVVPGSVVLD